jgi:hypothetical protein
MGVLIGDDEDVQTEIPDFPVLVARYKQGINAGVDVRTQLDEVKKQYEARIALIWREYETANAELIEMVKTADALEDILAMTLRNSIEKAYLATGNKQVYPGLSVRITKDYQYDERRAVEFCIERKIPELLTVKGKEFKKQMELTPQDFCTVSEKIGTVISLKATPSPETI